MPQPNISNRGYVKEVFPSIQGEGPHLGARHLFVRLAGCSAGCSWCDTDYQADKTFIIEDKTVQNPVSADTLAETLHSTYGLDTFQYVSVTGGEPLEQAEFAAELSEYIRHLGGRTLIETNGLHTAEISARKDSFDYFSIDIKLADGAPCTDPADLADAVKDINSEKFCLKFIIDENTSENTVIQVLSHFTHTKHCYLQAVDGRISLNKIDNLLKVLYKLGICGYFRPQIHKLIGVR